MIFLYECKDPECPAHRRFNAQFNHRASMFIVIHGSTAEKARAKAEIMLEYSRLKPTEHKAFGLKDRLAALKDDGPDDSDYEDLL